MVTQELITYIKKQLAQGVDKTSVSQELLSKGWLESDIQEAVLLATTQPPSPENNSKKRNFLLTKTILTITVSTISPFLLLFFLFAIAFNDSGGSLLTVISTVLLITSISLPFVFSLLLPALFIDTVMYKSKHTVTKVIIFIFSMFILSGIFYSIYMEILRTVSPVIYKEIMATDELPENTQ